MRVRIAAALGFAAGLMAAPAFAQQATTTTRGVHPVPPAEAVTNPSPNAAGPTESAPATPSHPMHHTMRHPMHPAMMHHPMPMHHVMTHAAAAADHEHMTIEQLNSMSLQAAKKGQNFTPPPGR